MAMFDFKDSEDIKAKDCKTTADVFMRGERLKRVEAENCHAGIQKSIDPVPKSPEKLISKVRLWIVENAIRTVISGVGAVVVAVIVAYYKLK